MIKAAPIFSDDMVLQHGKPVPVWGTGVEGSTIRVVWESSQQVEAKTKVYNGKWTLMLAPLAAGKHGELVVSDGTDEIRFKNVVTGDVWFAGGQSNMEMELVNCKNGVEELAACANPDIRFYDVVKRAVVDDDYLREEAASKWQVCMPETAAMLSAVAFFFARKINADTGIPIGIVNCSWGGTSISAWMSKEQLERSRAGQRFIDEYAAKVGGKTTEQYNAEMEDYFARWREWDKRIRVMRKKDPDVSWEVLNRECGQCPWPQPAGNTSPYCPGNLHTARIRRVAPFALRGFIYYQGEEDDQRADDYREMMYYLVRQWRDDWNDHSLPFLFVQLPMYASAEELAMVHTPRHWCLMREAQYLASLEIANTGLAVIIDCGEFDNIHPFDKQPVGFRLALQALKKVYGKDIEADGPIFSWAETEGSAMRLHFDNAQSGLEFRGSSTEKYCEAGKADCGDIPSGFEIAGAEGAYFTAQAKIDGSDVIVCSDKVAHPQRARYAWYKYGPTPLYSKNGLPAMPFRSNKDELINI
uniref:Sialic acid-specific 9-O-acetylesterase n=1 Tax=uncultured bacterium contig00066 TaxID=1181548 RepID=A0A806JY90_9BACT|nr:sialic acid-specific 9-O-acetylesterase [uncultured bacterium contig00066]